MKTSNLDFRQFLVDGLRPGTLYNVGNVVLLTSTGAIYGWSVAEKGGGAIAGLHLAFFGSPGTALATVATLTFFVAGQIYDRAWTAEPTTAVRLYRSGDLVCTVAAGLLTWALVVLGQTHLAILGGLLLTGSRLGLSLIPTSCRTRYIRHLLRCTVAASRIPSIFALALSLATTDAALSGAEVVSAAMLTACFFIWLAADLLMLGIE